jgi:hypothetical protein
MGDDDRKMKEHDPHGGHPGDHDPHMRGGEDGRGGMGMEHEGGHGDEHGDDDDIVPGAVTAGRLKTYIKPRIPTTQDVLDRRARKNAQSRARAAKLRERIAIIEQKPDMDRNEEEMQIFAQYENRRKRKNDRSRERALEKKEEIDRILAKPEKKRTKIEKQFLDNALSAKKRKNEGDRLRRQRLKEMGLAAKGAAMKAAAMARAARHGYATYPPPPYGYGGPPMSPMPMGYAQHPHMQSPGGFGSPPGMYPSPGVPQHQQQHGGGRGPPGGPPGTPQGGGMPYMPPRESYGDIPSNSPSPYQTNPHGVPGGGRVEQRRHADGSMSISIGGGAGGEGGPGDGGPPGVGNGGDPNISDVSHLLLYDNGEGGDGQRNGNDEGK